MKDSVKLANLIAEFVVNVDTRTGIPKFPKRATEIVKELSAYAQRESSLKITEESWQDNTTPEEIYESMLHLIIQHMPALDKALATQRRCRICGCTDNNACIPYSCYWVEADLCSECIEVSKNAPKF